MLFIYYQYGNRHFDNYLIGNPSSVYNAVDENTCCSIAEIAKPVVANSVIEVEYDIQGGKANDFPRILYMNLDVSTLRKLGRKTYMDCFM